jgi:hypothetical protein
MSTYGRLWQQVSDIRNELKHLGVVGDTLADARKASDKKPADTPRVGQLLRRWAQCEEEMKDCDENTGEP